MIVICGKGHDDIRIILRRLASLRRQISPGLLVRQESFLSPELPAAPRLPELWAIGRS